MTTFQEIQLRHVQELEDYIQALDEEYKNNREPAAQELDRIRSAFSNGRGTKNGSDPVQAPQQSTSGGKAELSELKAMESVEEVAPQMRKPFTVTELVENIQKRFPDREANRESIRGAFRVYLKRPKCPVALHKAIRGRFGSQYEVIGVQEPLI